MPIGGAPFAYYEFQLDDNIDFSSPVVDDNTTLTDRLVSQYQFPTDPLVLPPLTANKTYYWRVRAVDQLIVAGVPETSAWSPTWSFRTVIQPPALSLPVDDATGTSRTPLLDWSDVPGNSGYILEVWKDGATPIIIRSAVLIPNVSQYQFITALLPNTTYFWRVQTKALNGPSAWSETFYFTTGP